MLVYRLAKRKYATPISGYGASLTNFNRWNSKGTEIIYTAASNSLAILEVLVHVNEYEIPDDYVFVTIKVHTKSPIQIAAVKDLKDVEETQSIGDQFIKENTHLLLKVPSVIVPSEYNVLLNPFHPKFKNVVVKEVESFQFDERLLR